MRRILCAVIAAAAAYVLVMVSPALADTCCWWCEEGVCVGQYIGGPGYHECISTFDPVGCMANNQTACHAGPNNPDLCGGASPLPMTTLAAIYRLEPAALDRLFEGSASPRLLRWQDKAFDCTQVGRKLAELTGDEATSVELAYWHFTVGRGANTFGASAQSGGGYAYRASQAWGERNRIVLYATEAGHSQSKLADVTIAPGNLLLTRVTLGGSEYVLALRVQPEAEDRLVATQEAFRKSVQSYPSRNRIDLRLIGADEAATFF